MLDKEKYMTKTYLHFDHKVKIEKVESYVTNPIRIAKHSFLPLIHYVSSFQKNIGEKNPEYDNRPIKSKSRDIMYAGHWDSFIYKYYADILNDCYYNEFCTRFGIDNCVTAYRNNKRGKSNIDFAAEIINQIVDYNEAYILVGDFTEYFDKIDHALLKDNLKIVMGTSRLSKDWYNVYRSITKYGYYEKDSLIKKFGSDRSLRAKKVKSYFEQIGDFRNFQKACPVEYNRNSYGIPQGTAISAVLANVYAINFDLKLKQIADEYNGIYRRYSDDFILVIPKEETMDESCFRNIDEYIRKLAFELKIEIQESKTGLYTYQKESIVKTTDSKVRRLDYLGFIFNGKTVRMRGKSPYKFYRQAKKLINHAKYRKRVKKLPKLPYRKSIYGLYTDLGEKRGDFGNFVAYAKRAQRKFDEISPNTNNLIIDQIKNRKKIVEKMLGVKIHTKV